MTWIAEHPVWTALIPVAALLVAAVAVFMARFYRRPPAVVEQVHARMVEDRDGPRLDDSGWPGLSEAVRALHADPLQDPDDDGSGWGEDYPHDRAVPQVVAAESPDASWMDTVRASMPTPPLDVRRIGDDEEIDPDSVVEGEAVGGNTSWFTPTHELPARPDRVLRPVGRAPALEMAEAMPPLTSWALEKRFNAPKQDEDGEFMPGEVGIFDHSNLTGAFRPWRDVLAEGEGA